MLDFLLNLFSSFLFLLLGLEALGIYWGEIIRMLQFPEFLFVLLPIGFIG